MGLMIKVKRSTAPFMTYYRIVKNKLTKIINHIMNVFLSYICNHGPSDCGQVILYSRGKVEYNSNCTEGIVTFNVSSSQPICP